MPFVVLFIILFVLSACKPFSKDKEAAIAALTGPENLSAEQPVEQSSMQTPPSTPTSQETTNNTTLSNTTEQQSTPTPLQTPASTNNLTLQSDLTQCQHLSPNFECNRYDLRDCKYQTLVGKNEFYPDQLVCRFGKGPGEYPTRKYCYSQDCKRITERNVVIKYGGVIAFGEYRYSVRKEGDGIVTSYELVRCGEMTKTFATIEGCRRHIITLP
ncbi:hypothetical protein HZB03_03735 [Candidatus Woesearchaeota archaeon]|nr:hypothetical protein [Candidatus Woesearchaeota archaeon]